MAAKFARFHEKRSYETSADQDMFDREDDEELLEVEKATLDVPISEDNVGYQLILKMGWKSGSGLGRKLQGRTDPIPIVLKEDFTGIGKMKEEMAHAEESTSKRKTLEIEKEETEELKQKYLVGM
ncbi:G patch domain-containing protein 8, partial [Exaiptasia diaphana]